MLDFGCKGQKEKGKSDPVVESHCAIHGKSNTDCFAVLSFNSGLLEDASGPFSSRKF